MENAFLRVLVAACDEIGTPRALAIKLLAQHGEWAQLSQLRCETFRYADSESYFYDAVVTDLLRKCDLPSGVDKKGAAVATFWACERQNYDTNERLTRYLPEFRSPADATEEAVSRFIAAWRKEVKSIVGNLPDHLTPRFSGGATYADVGQLITVPDKMTSKPTVYSGARLLLPFWEETAWARACGARRIRPSDVRGNLFFTVPKDGKTFRGCCKEASINITLQLDVGRALKSRLKRVGVDLKQGQSTHRDLARAASLDESLATIDMSNASDTLCRILPKLVLPAQWYELLDSLRATHTEIGGKWVRLEKFSSMGNGFTFELETLVFLTLARTICRLSGADPEKVSCYGDDLIVPGGVFRDVIAGLRMFGFTPNERKTFGEGPFRESCGGDFWRGVPVRAHYVESLPNEPQHWISLANGLRRICAGPHRFSRWRKLRKAWWRSLDPIPSDIRRCRGPQHLGDIVIHDVRRRWSLAQRPSRDVANLTELKNGQHDPTWDLQYVKAYVPLPKVLPWHHWTAPVQLASCTLGLPSVGITPRGGVSGYRIKTVGSNLTSSWLPVT
jgi:hypothetical protein